MLILLLGLLATGSVYGLAAPRAESDTYSASDVDAGSKLFATNCATCHGPSGGGTASGPSLIGVGAAAVDFQVGTGRMPMAQSGPQAPAKPPQLSAEQTRQLAAYVASLGPGPAIPDDSALDTTNASAANGMSIFRTNCAMCHGASASGGALSDGMWAPSLLQSSPTHIYEAMVTGPQSMPVFNDVNLTPEQKADVIAYLQTLQEQPSPGGWTLGGLGPVSEGLAAWVIGLGLLVGCAIWLGAKSS